MELNSLTIYGLVDRFLTRELLLPEMQRKYVWRSTQVRDLLDSVYRDYPSGSILIWETDSLPELKAPSFDEAKQGPIGKKLLLLDGQQRVTSLASILTGCPVRIKEGTNIKEKFVDIFFNIDHPDEDLAQEETARFEVGDTVEGKWTDNKFYPGKIAKVDKERYYIQYDDGEEGWTDEIHDLSDERKKELYFQIRSRKIENKPNWISVTKLFKDNVGSILKTLGTGADHPNFVKYNDRLTQLYSRRENYIYPVQIIRDKSYKEVTDIFVRVNTSGTRLRSSDLALAQITSTWPGSMRLFESFVDKCIETGFYLDENFLARCVVCIATGQPKFENIGRISAERLREAWEQTKKGVQKTINFVKNIGLVDSSALLPSPILLIPLVYEATRSDLSKTEDSERALLYWFYNAAIWGRYSGSMETRLAQDLSALSGDGCWDALTENIWQTVGKDRRPTAEDFRGKGINSPLFFMMYILARQKKARDLETGDIINYTNFGTNNQIEFDHIFPKSKLESFYKGKLENDERKKIVNEISNLAFMTKKGNIIKTNDDPATYFPKVQKAHKGDDLFVRQQIPSSPGLLHYEKYEEFLEERAKLLASEMNALLGSLERQRS